MGGGSPSCHLVWGFSGKLIPKDLFYSSGTASQGYEWALGKDSLKCFARRRLGSGNRKSEGNCLLKDKSFITTIHRGGHRISHLKGTMP